MTKTPIATLRKKFLLSFSFVILLALIVSAFFFFQAIDHIKKDGIKHPPRSPFRMFVSGERTMNGTGSFSSGSIEGWMTFDYVNTMYGLPKEYLRDTLHIEDVKYPRIPIARYAKDIGFSKEDFVRMVVRAVELSPKMGPTP